MDIADAIDFLRERHHGILITRRVDGRPQSSNITYWVGDDGRIRISVTDDRAKTKNLRRQPSATLHVNREDFWAYVVIDAEVELLPVAESPDDATADALVEYYRAVAGEHDDWDAYRQAMVDDRRLLLILSPTHSYGQLDR